MTTENLIGVDELVESRAWAAFDPVFAADLLDPDRATSPWSGHRWFGYDLVRWMRPATIVELGTHFGCSFFAFCQALHDAELDTKIIAVDTWEGDPQAGYYGPEVFNLVRRILDSAYASVRAELIQNTFDNALVQVADGSVDLLHIDGFHAYEAVQHDFESWLPKLAADGVVLLHDSAPSSGYGSARFFDELRRRYPSLLFPHNFGLGVVFPKGVGRGEFLLSEEFLRWSWAYEYRGRYESTRRINEANIALIEEKDRAVAATSELVDQRNEALAATEALVAERDATISSMQQLIDERDATVRRLETVYHDLLQESAALVAEKDRAIEATSQLVAEKDRAIEATSQLVAERDAAIESMRSHIAEQARALQAQAELIDERDETISELAGLYEVTNARAISAELTARTLEDELNRIRAENNDLALIVHAIRREQAEMLDRVSPPPLARRRWSSPYRMARLWAGRAWRLSNRAVRLPARRGDASST